MTNTSENFIHPKDIQKMTAEELIAKIQGKKAVFTYEGKTVRGKIVGAILNPMNHPYIYKAYHVELIDGRKVTTFATGVTIQE